MLKTIIKEIGIVILLLIAVILVLAIIFYDYIPNNKRVPIKIQAYEIPEEIEQELEESIPEGQDIVETYYIDDMDLDLYESTNDYDKGKPNPFAYYQTSEEQGSTNSVENNNTNNNIDSGAQGVTQDDTNNNEVYINTPGKNY